VFYSAPGWVKEHVGVPPNLVNPLGVIIGLYQRLHTKGNASPAGNAREKFDESCYATTPPRTQGEGQVVSVSGAGKRVTSVTTRCATPSRIEMVSAGMSLRKPKIKGASSKKNPSM
jgi:hypothetical protein